MLRFCRLLTRSEPGHDVFGFFWVPTKHLIVRSISCALVHGCVIRERSVCYVVVLILASLVNRAGQHVSQGPFKSFYEVIAARSAVVDFRFTPSCLYMSSIVFYRKLLPWSLSTSSGTPCVNTIWFMKASWMLSAVSSFRGSAIMYLVEYLPITTRVFSLCEFQWSTFSMAISGMVCLMEWLGRVVLSWTPKLFDFHTSHIGERMLWYPCSCLANSTCYGSRIEFSSLKWSAKGMSWYWNNIFPRSVTGARIFPV